MKAFKGLLLLFLISCAIEAVFVGLYQYEAHCPLKSMIDEHTLQLQSGTIPDASQIDIRNAPWAKVAHFEDVFGELHLLVDPLFALVVVWFFMCRGISISMRDFANRVVSGRHGKRVLYLCLSVLSYAFIFLPQTVSGYLVGHLRGTDTTIPSDAIYTAFTNPVMTVIYTLALFIPLYWIIDRYKKKWWVVAAVFVTVFSVAMAFIDPVVIEPLYVQATPLADGALKTALVGMTQRAGVPIERIYVNDISWQSLESNAGVTGVGWTKRIELDDTLINFYSQPEIVFIVAHELGHYVHGDLIWDTLISAVFTFISFWLIALMLRFWIKTRGRKDGIRDESDIALYPLIGFVFLVFGFATSPISCTISRSIEARADAYALELTNDPVSGIGGFKKLAYQSFVDPSPPAFLHFWFDTHPSLEERIAALSGDARK